MHPCCNGSLQTGTKVIAIVELLLSISTCVYGVCALLFFSAAGYLNTTGFKEDETGKEVHFFAEHNEAFSTAIGVFAMIFSIIVIVIGVISILLAVLLLMGAIKRNRKFCMVWFVISVIFLILGVLGTVWNIAEGDNTLIFSIFLRLLLESYFLWVVWAFMSELKEEALVSPHSHPKPRA